MYELMLAYGCWWGKMLFELLIRQEQMKERFEHGYEMGGKLADTRKKTGRLKKDFSDESLKRLEELGYTGN